MLNRLVRFRVRRGYGPRHRVLLTVTNSRTGRPYTTPVSVVDEGDQRWLVAPYGEVGWVRHARAAGRVALERGMAHAAYRLRPVAPAEAAPVLRRYLALEPITRPYFDAGSDSPLAAFEAEADRHPVFELAAPD
jgi:deazaflavin-dependent oxidoreductase (nitroreductase family)